MGAIISVLLSAFAGKVITLLQCNGAENGRVLADEPESDAAGKQS
ncbi:hypothetical protein [uncultured Microbulbifer sp.]|nr:hypothetical protein [uncultured Microbulbifer sp.]